MFNSVAYTYDINRKVYTFRGNFGLYFKRYLEKNVVSKKKINKLFINVNFNSIEIYEFFLLELYYICKFLLEKEITGFGVNLATIQSLVEVLEHDTWIGNETAKEIKHILDYKAIEEKMNYKVLDHQQIALDRFEEMKTRLGFRGGYIAAAVGAGKTFLSLAIAEGMKSNKIIAIVPLPTINRVWVDSITGEMYKEPQSYWSSKDSKKYSNERFIICHYEGLKDLVKMVKELKTNNVTVIVDEAHNFNESKSTRTVLLTKFINDLNPENVVLLSGTPIKARATELATMLELLDPKFDSKIKKRFLDIYKSPSGVLKSTLPIRYGNYTVVIEKEELKLPDLNTLTLKVKLKNGKDYTLETIRKEMTIYIKERTQEIKNNWDRYVERYNYLYNKAKNQLLSTGYPLREFKTYENDFETIQKFYKDGKLMQIPDVIVRVNKFEKNILEPVLMGEEKKEFRDVKSVLKYLALKIQGEVLGRIVGRKRIDCHVDLARNLKYEEILNTTIKKTVIFSNYIDVAAAAKETTESKGFKPVSVYGEDTKYLTTIVKKFMEVKEINPLVATYKSLSTGVPLIVANLIICIDLPFRHHIYQQAIGRVWRLGQDTPVFIYNIELDTGEEPNINSRNIDIIQWSKEQVEEITGDKINIKLKGEVIEEEKEEVENLGLENLKPILYLNKKQEDKKEIDIIDIW